MRDDRHFSCCGNRFSEGCSCESRGRVKSPQKECSKGVNSDTGRSGEVCELVPLRVIPSNDGMVLKKSVKYFEDVKSRVFSPYIGYILLLLSGVFLVFSGVFLGVAGFRLEVLFPFLRGLLFSFLYVYWKRQREVVLERGRELKRLSRSLVLAEEVVVGSVGRRERDVFDGGFRELDG